MKSLTTLAERQATMRDRVNCRPCQDGRSRRARRARARLIKLEEVVPRSEEFVVKRRAARFMSSKNYSRLYIANQLGITELELNEMLGEERTFGPSEGVRHLFRQLDREQTREAKDPLLKLLRPETVVTFVPAFVGEVPARSDKEEAARRAELAEIRERESRDAAAGRRR